MLSLFILIPLFIVMIMHTLFRNSMKRVAFMSGLFLTALQVFLVLTPAKELMESSSYFLGYLFKFELSLDNLSQVLLLSIGLVSFVTILVSRSFIRDEDERFNFISLLLLAVSGMNAAVMVRDIFSLYVFLEVAAVASFIIIAFNKTNEAFEGAFKYLIFSATATVFMLSGIALLVLICGSTSFSVISSILRNTDHDILINIAMALFIIGVLIKSGLMPFHGWLPDTYTAAPAYGSLFLAGIVTKVVGVYSLLRVGGSVFAMPASLKMIFMFLGAFSIVVAAIAALEQDDLKRMLSYSSISQVGYIILGFGCATPLGVCGAILHLFNHAVFKSLLFVNSASLELETGTTDMKKMGGLAKNMPFTGITSLLGSLSVAGMPPLSGFWSKLIIIMALWMSGHYIYALIAVLASLVTLAYMLSMQRRVFWGNPLKEWEKVKDSDFSIILASLILASVIVIMGIFFPFMFNTFIFPLPNIW